MSVLEAWPVFDGHNDLPWRIRQLGLDAQAAIDRVENSHTDLDRLRAGGVGAQWWSVWVRGDQPEADAVVEVLQQIELVHAWIARHGDRMALCTTAADVAAARSRGVLASLLGAEGGHSIASSLEVLRALHRLGVRYMTLTHNFNVGWADSATDKPDVGGLSDFGREVVREMERLGVLVDLSHVADTTMNDALDVATKPVLFSHSSARAVCDHVRNVPDDVLARLPGNGGVCQVTFVAPFVSNEVKEWELENGGHEAAGPDRPVATVSQLADHVDHVRDVAGVDHVGIGGDYDGCVHLVDRMHDVSCYPALIEELASRGWSDDDLGKLTWRNALRVLAGG
jgi:membrane dipeptidase